MKMKLLSVFVVVICLSLINCFSKIEERNHPFDASGTDYSVVFKEDFETGMDGWNVLTPEAFIFDDNQAGEVLLVRGDGASGAQVTTSFPKGQHKYLSFKFKIPTISQSGTGLSLILYDDAGATSPFALNVNRGIGGVDFMSGMTLFRNDMSAGVWHTIEVKINISSSLYSVIIDGDNVGTDSFAPINNIGQLEISSDMSSHDSFIDDIIISSKEPDTSL